MQRRVYGLSSAVDIAPAYGISVVIIKRERGVRIWYTAVWGKGVPQRAHAKASLPPEGPDTHWHSIDSIQ